MNICLICVLYNLQKLSVESFTKYMCMYISCPTKTDLLTMLNFYPHFYAVFWQPFWKWQTSWKFWKRRIAPRMVTYHYVKFYVSIIIYLEVININVRNFNFP
jgi:hypothetical protein